MLPSPSCEIVDTSVPGYLPETFCPGFHDEAACKRMKYRQLYPLRRQSDGAPMTVSILSFGASSLGGVFHETDDEEAIAVVLLAIRSGINFIDVAAWYGHGRAERVLGRALAQIPRKAYYLSTKACRYEPEVLKMFDWSYERTMRSINESIKRCQCAYLDIIQIHDPEFAPSVNLVLKETLPAMLDAKSMGKVNFIGTTGFPFKVHRDLILGAEKLGHSFDTTLSYCHYTLNDTSLTDSWLPFLQEHGIALINASPIAMGLLSNRGPPKWHPATPEIKDACKRACEFCTEHGVDLTRLAVHFTLTEPRIPTTLVSTASIKRMTANLAVVTEGLSELEAKTLSEVRTRFFEPLKNASWEDIEVLEYWEKRRASKSSPEVA